MGSARLALDSMWTRLSKMFLEASTFEEQWMEELILKFLQWPLSKALIVKVTFGCTRVALVRRQPQDNLGLLSP